MAEAGAWKARAVLAAAYVAGLAVAVGLGAALGDLHPIWRAAAADVAATAVVFACSLAVDNSSIYDPYWSVAPVPIVLYWAGTGAGAGPRGAWVVLVVLAWGLRLTWNQLLRWRGLGHEDFRYAELRAKAGRGYWPLSFVGIHLMPTIWVFLGLLAAWPALGGPGRALGPLDALGAVVAGGAVWLEATADRQLRTFLRTRRDPAAVLEDGVWAWCRHPNYLGEIAFWWGLWLSGVAADPGWWWTVVGPLAITALFLGVSIPWMDRRMLAGHPAYAARLRAVPALLPRLPGAGR